MIKRTAAGIEIVTLAEGVITELHVELKDTMNGVVPEGPCGQDVPRTAQPGRVGKVRGRAVLGCDVVRVAISASKLWNDSTIRGHAKRGTGLINNELYIGKAGLASAALPQEPGDRQVGVVHQPAGEVSRCGSSRAPHRGRCVVAGGEGTPGRDRREIRRHHRGDTERPCQPS